MGSMLIMGDRGRVTTCLTLGFRVHPNYGNDLRRQYNQILSEIAASDMLLFIVNQLDSDITTVQLGDLDAQEVLTAEYALS